MFLRQIQWLNHCPLTNLVRRPDGSVGVALVLPALTDCRWWFDSLLVHSGVSSATRRKATGADHKKKVSFDKSCWWVLFGGHRFVFVCVFCWFVVIYLHFWALLAVGRVQICFYLLMLMLGLL